MKALSLLAVILTLGLSLGMSEAEAARRLGGGKSFGVQRQMTAPQRTPTAAPAQKPSTAAAPGAATQTPKRSWMGPIAGLAAGLGLAALASHLGFGGELASVLMLGLLVMAAIALVGFIMRKRNGVPSPSLAGAGAGFQRRDPGSAYTMPFEKSEGTPMTDASITSDAQATRNIPSDFDIAGFERNAKVNFIRLQAANDAGNIDDIREFTTPEMFAEIKMDFAERHGAAQTTDVVSIDADVLEVIEEATRYIVSVRFVGLLREGEGNEDKDVAAEPIDEIWHLVKPREGSGGWLLAGIQQTAQQTVDAAGNVKQ